MLREYSFCSEMTSRTLLQVSFCWGRQREPCPGSHCCTQGTGGDLASSGGGSPDLHCSTQSQGSTTCLSPLWWKLSQPNLTAKRHSQVLAGVKLGTSPSSWSVCCLNEGLCVYERLPCQGQTWTTVIPLQGMLYSITAMDGCCHFEYCRTRYCFSSCTKNPNGQE